MTSMSKYLRFATGIAGLAVVLAACSGAASAGAETDGAVVTTVEAADGTEPTTTGTAATSKVSANTATVDEIAAALAAAGVDEADRWAREVVEYRPYDTSDPDLTHLRDELAKYNPAAGVVDQIVSALEP
jgi:hypothetical protein